MSERRSKAINDGPEGVADFLYKLGNIIDKECEEAIVSGFEFYPEKRTIDDKKRKTPVVQKIHIEISIVGDILFWWMREGPK